jgi:hypothetical protein
VTPVLLEAIEDPVARWAYAERHLSGGTRTYSRYAGDLDISPRFHPEHGAPRFAVPTFVVEAPAGNYLIGAVASRLNEAYLDGRSFLLPVHPDTLTLPAVREDLAGCRTGPPLEVVPTANARTVLVERLGGRPVEPHFVKLHYPRRLSRFTRRLRRPVIELHLWVAAELDRIGAPFLPEVGGGVLGTDPDHAWGFLLRDSRAPGGGPLPYTVPLFALYGRDLRAPGDPTLLEQLVAGSDEDPESWLARRVVEPMITLWTESLLGTGCAVELHGQNTLFGFSADGRTTRIAARDCAVYVDPQIRRERGMSAGLPPRNVISRDVRQPRSQVFSLVYDSFMGHHTLDFLARLARDRFGVPPAALHRVAKAAFAAQPVPPGLLPGTVHYYDDELHADGRWELVDTGLRPRWR